MRRRGVLLLVVSCLTLCLPVLASAGASAARDGRPAPGPGTPADSSGRSGWGGVSCPSKGDCTAAGTYSRKGGGIFVILERHSAWGKAEALPGGKKIGASGVNSLSCASPGNCALGGYTSSADSDTNEAMIATQRKGKWSKAEVVPGLHAIRSFYADAFINSVSCTSPGNCSAGGSYGTDTGATATLVVTETHGRWGKAARGPGDGISSISCWSAGNCAALAGGTDSSVILTQKKGTWVKTETMPGLVNLVQVSCWSAGNCTAAGSKEEPGEISQAFVIADKAGHWTKGEIVPGTAALNGGGNAAATALSCVAGANCSMVGYYAPESREQLPFAANEIRGTWKSAEQVPGTTLDFNPYFNSVSCGTAGNCAAGGWYYNSDDVAEAAFASQKNGIWAAVQELPGSGAITGGAGPFTVSCGAANSCSGLVFAANGDDYLTLERNQTWQRAENPPGI